jgi:hypothetical protein
MEEQKEIRVQYRQQQEKYTYYIIALCVTAIGFSIHKTSGLPLACKQIPVGIAVLSWGASIYCGLKFLRGGLGVLYDNHQYYEIIQGRDPDIGKEREKINKASNLAEKLINQKSEKVSKFFDWQFRLFSIGFVSFLIWHILEMYMNTN